MTTTMLVASQSKLVSGLPSAYPPKLSMAAVSAPPLVNCAEVASKYFADIRTPASFLAGAAVVGLFSIKTSPSTWAERGRLEYWLRFSYAWLMFVTFALSTNTIVLSTAAYVTTRNTEAFNPLAVSAWELLHREFLYDFALTRWSFEIGLLCFLAAVVFRVLVEFRLAASTATKRQRLMGVAALLFSASLITHLTSYLNSMYLGWENLLTLTRDVVKLVAARSIGHRPFEMLSVILAVIGSFCFGSGILLPPV